MIPLFKSHFSIGKSILKLESGTTEASDGIFNIAEELKLKNVVLVEDSLTGFLESAKLSKAYGLDLIFGLRLTACSNLSTEKDCHKVIVFAKNDSGCKQLNKIYSKAFETEAQAIDMNDLADLWQEENLKLAIPFYDSFIFNNIMSFSTCVPNFSFTNPTFFTEDNNLPFDSIIKEKVLDFTSSKKLKHEKTKSIYYKNREDFEAFQTYKCICGRTGWKGKSVSLEKPNLDHCGSKEFCIESWKENI